MVDCGTTALFINERFVKRHKIRSHLLHHEIPLYNINGSRNRAGKISRFAPLKLVIGESESWQEFLITDLGPEVVVLGLPWLRNVNPDINWAEGTMRVKGKGKEEAKVEQVEANRVQQQ
jgi:hypothetical protein